MIAALLYFFLHKKERGPPSPLSAIFLFQFDTHHSTLVEVIGKAPYVSTGRSRRYSGSFVVEVLLGRYSQLYVFDVTIKN
jgi:hypothetical protein